MTAKFYSYIELQYRHIINFHAIYIPRAIREFFGNKICRVSAKVPQGPKL